MPVRYGRHTTHQLCLIFLLAVIAGGNRSGGSLSGTGRTGSDALLDLLLELVRHFRVILKELLGSIAALGDLGAIVAVPRTALLDDFELCAEVDDLAVFADAFAEHDLEFRNAERRRQLVLHHFNLD